MADTKITGLTETTTLDAADALVTVDVSDTTMAPSGTNKYITKENLLTAIGAQEMAITEEIGRVTASGSVITFSNIPQNYDRLIIEGYITSDYASTTDHLHLYFNGDMTDANYFKGQTSAVNTSNATSETATPAIGIIAGASASGSSRIRVTIEGYATSEIKAAEAVCIQQRTAGSEVGRTSAAMYHDSMTAGITSLEFQSRDHASNFLTGELILYGVRTGTVAPEQPNVQTHTVLTPVKTIDLSVDGEADFTNIPQTGKRLVIKGKVRSSVTAAFDGTRLYLNTDTTDGNYTTQEIRGDDGAAANSERAYPTFGWVSAASSPATAYSQIEIVVEDYTGTDRKTVRAEHTSYLDTARLSSGTHGISSTVTAAIDRIRLRTDNHATDTLTGEVTLYVEEDATIGAVTYPGDAGTAGRFLQKVSRKVVTNGEFDWDNIPQHADSDLVIKGWIKSDYTASTVQEVYGIFNTDTTAGNYHAQRGGYAANGTPVGDEVSAPRVGRCVTSHASTPANAYTEIEIRIPNYTGANRKNILSKIHTYRNNDEIEAGHEFVTSEITNAITRFRVRTNNHSTNTLTGELALYIERDLVLTPGKHELETIELTAAGTFDFDNIPSGFKRLWVQGYIRVTGATDDDSIYCHINGDTTDANYQYDFTREAAGGTGAGFQGALPLVWHAPGTTAISNDGYATVQLVFEGYDNNISLQDCRGESHFWSTTNYAFKGYSFMTHQTATSPITRLHFVTDNDPTDKFAAGSKLTLYGEH